jgi:predicted GIY-YIG superfamily endonuclease
MTIWHVYQLHSDTELLYVGYTRQRLQARLGQHRRKKPWWPEVTDIRSEEFATEDEARQREKELWADGQPKYNLLSPFQTDEERRAQDRAYTKMWARTHREASRESCRGWYERNREAKLLYQREYSNRPEVRARERDRWRRLRGVPRQAKGWRQTGPGLF